MENNSEKKQITLSKPSVQSLMIKLYFNDTLLSRATGFLVKAREGEYVLVTNRHNLTGRHQETLRPIDNESAAIPNHIEILHHLKNQLGSWRSCKQPLYKDPEAFKEPLWVEHTTFGKDVDVVALHVDNSDLFDYYPYDLCETTNVLLAPTEIVSVVGFPFGLTGGGYLALWATGFVASEPAFDFKNLPMFLIDCRTRQGQSGSPVIAHRNSGYVTSNNSTIIGGQVTQLLGIYSGRINSESDLGMVWNLDAIRGVVDGLVR